MQRSPNPEARHVLVLEDEGLIALDLQTCLRKEGYRVVGPFSRPEQALEALQSDMPDAGVLDVSLGDANSLSVADALAAAGVPFLWLTGLEVESIPPVHSQRPMLKKPYVRRILLDTLARILQEQ